MRRTGRADEYCLQHPWRRIHPLSVRQQRGHPPRKIGPLSIERPLVETYGLVAEPEESEAGKLAEHGPRILGLHVRRRFLAGIVVAHSKRWSSLGIGGLGSAVVGLLHLEALTCGPAQPTVRT